VLRNEDPAEYRAFALGIIADLGADGPLEMKLAEYVCAAIWRRDRWVRYETAKQNVLLYEAQPLAAALRQLRGDLKAAECVEAALSRLDYKGRVRPADLRCAWSLLKGAVEAAIPDAKAHLQYDSPAYEEANAIICRVRGTVSLEAGRAVWSQLFAIARRVVLELEMDVDDNDPEEFLERLTTRADHRVRELRAKIDDAERKEQAATSETLTPITDGHYEGATGRGGYGEMERRLEAAVDRALNRFHANRAALAAALGGAKALRSPRVGAVRA
jgi:hypothetical protein